MIVMITAKVYETKNSYTHKDVNTQTRIQDSDI